MSQRGQRRVCKRRERGKMREEAGSIFVPLWWKTIQVCRSTLFFFRRRKSLLSPTDRTSSWRTPGPGSVITKQIRWREEGKWTSVWWAYSLYCNVDLLFRAIKPLNPDLMNIPPTSHWLHEISLLIDVTHIVLNFNDLFDLSSFYSHSLVISSCSYYLNWEWLLAHCLKQCCCLLKLNNKL